MVGLASLASMLGPQVSEKTSAVYIIELDEKDQIVPDRSRRFQYFPETLTDTKAVNYQRYDIPGGSLPIYQWISSGERLVSFEAVFSTDVNLRADPTLDTTIAERISNVGATARNVDIRGALVWLRRFMLPQYTEVTEAGTGLSLAPRKLILFIPGTGIGLAGGGGGEASGTGNSSMLCLMTQCDVTYEALFPNGLPRIATVQLAFAQIAQRAGYVAFPSVDKRMNSILDTSAEGDAKIRPYLLTEKGRVA